MVLRKDDSENRTNAVEDLLDATGREGYARLQGLLRAAAGIDHAVAVATAGPDHVAAVATAEDQMVLRLQPLYCSSCLPNTHTLTYGTPTPRATQHQHRATQHQHPDLRN